MLAINSYNEEQYNMSRQKCILLNESLPPVFNKLGSNFDLEIFANEWGKNNKINHTQAYKAGPQGKDYISISIHNKFIVPHKTGYSYSKLYFVKSSYCEISKGNCYAYMQPESYQKINYICRFYFDDRGKLVPSNSTAKFISGEN